MSDLLYFVGASLRGRPIFPITSLTIMSDLLDIVWASLRGRPIFPAELKLDSYKGPSPPRLGRPRRPPLQFPNSLGRQLSYIFSSLQKICALWGNQLLNFAIQAARDAGGILVQRLGSAKVSNKGAIDLVTEADLAAEELIIERIQSHYPQHRILAEESGEAASLGTGPSDWKWIIDPLDGTTNYAHGYPCFCVSIAAERAGSIEIGVIYDPMRDEMFAAERGQGATLNDRKIRVSDVEDLNRAMVCTGFPYNVRERPDFARDFANFTMNAQAVRRDGSAAIDLAYVACGRFDGFFEDGLNPWDMAAGILLIKEAGGRVTDFDDAPLDIYTKKVVASNGLVHDAMLGLLRK